jgi:DUF1365 family protein
MTGRSALYVGSVMHRRLRPSEHRLRYRMFWMLLDLDEIDGLANRLRLFSHNRFNVASFHDRDHGDGGGEPLRAQVERHLNAAGIDLGGGSIRLLCMPRILGYGFNPLSIYFCYRKDDRLAAILYEVHNTFGQRHSYLAPVLGCQGALVHTCKKSFYVSPFLDLDMAYAFRVVPPVDRVAATIRTEDSEGPIIIASLAGRREPLTCSTLLRALAMHPFLTLKVIAAIHWHALLLWRKGVPLQSRPSPPASSVTVVSSHG